MKLNVSYPATGCQKLFEVVDEHKLRIFYEKRMGAEVEADLLGDEWKGYVLRVAGGNDKQGFPMKQGVLTNSRVRLLMSKGHSCYRPRRTGERKRKSVRGCIVDANLSVLALEIPGLTDGNVPRRLGPKRASKIRKLFNLSKEDDVRRYVVKRVLPPKEGKENAKPRSKTSYPRSAAAPTPQTGSEEEAPGSSPRRTPTQALGFDARIKELGQECSTKLNVSYPATGCQKLFEVVDEHKLRIFYEKRMGAEVEADLLGDEWKGYVLRVAGGNDKQGFPMKQGVLTNSRVRLLMSKGHSCYRPRRTGERKRKSVRGCIVDANLSEIPGLTDGNVPRRLGPKRASKIRKLFNLSKEDDVRRYVVKRVLPPKEGKENAKPRSKVRRQEELRRRRSASMRESKSSDKSAPQKSPDLEQLYQNVTGTIMNKNTIEEFKNTDKAALLNSDLKKFHYYYWFAYPAPSQPTVYLKEPSSSITTHFNNKQLENLAQAYKSFDLLQKNFFIILKENDDIALRTLAEVLDPKLPVQNELCVDLSNAYFVFADPSNTSNPGWPMRLFLAALLEHCPFLTKNDIKVIGLRCHVNGAVDRSLVFTVTAPENVQATESAGWVGWERNDRGNFGPKLANMSASMDPIKLEHKTDEMASGARYRRGGDENHQAWGFRHITFVDNGKVSYSNPTRQVLYTHADCAEGRPKAQAAADNLRLILPTVKSEGFALHIPMPGHPVGESLRPEAEAGVARLRELIASHDASLKDRTLDQQCTVTRPGVAAIAGALAVEILDTQNIPADLQGVLGPIPHSIRGFLHSYQSVAPTCAKFKQCIACSDTVIDKYRKEGVEFVFKVLNSGSYLEEVTGLSELQLTAEMTDCRKGFTKCKKKTKCLKVVRSPDLEQLYQNVTGTIMNKNTIEEFKNTDKAALLNSVGEAMWTNIKTKIWITKPSVLSNFIVISFADLKKFHYYYWFAYPAPSQPTVYLKEPSSSITTHFNNKQLENLAQAYKSFDLLQKNFFIILKENDDIALKTLAEVLDPKLPVQNELCVDLSNAYFVFADPSNTSNPGWPMRLFLAALLEHCPFLTKNDIKVIGLRCHVNGAVDRSLVFTVTAPEAWGFRHITFVDNGKVSYSNPTRQVLYTHADCAEGRPKAQAAADNLRLILPTVKSEGFALHIPMPGHPVGESLRPEAEAGVARLRELIASHDAVFLLLDTREARWLPTLIAAHYGKIVINAALGFDSYLVMRHGAPSAAAAPNAPATANAYLPGAALGCYFCNDVTAPGNSLKDRTLDQQCTVTRPGVAAIAGALAVEILVGLLQHPLRIHAPALCNLSEDTQNIPADLQGVLGPIPHSIRGFLHSYQSVAPTCAKFKQCIACSDTVIDKYRKEGVEFVQGAQQWQLLGGSYCLSELQLTAEMTDILTFSDEDDDED
ncbi:hypothetical protein MSG28_012421 [Choristoneura fumiferana]|uniref:Uncharacterized protein n=1 Tax=Choristoneura fumiferana TaxID=7141 RepID=A0ACC0KDR4_CHOFU|nr:hypothetical protein MSG28_012421 [Choristoneura fumiferana]